MSGKAVPFRLGPGESRMLRHQYGGGAAQYFMKRDGKAQPFRSSAGIARYENGVTHSSSRPLNSIPRDLQIKTTTCETEFVGDTRDVPVVTGEG